jgi:hypothetical protein
VDLGFQETVRLQQRNQAVDALKAKFGEQIIHRGLTGGENLAAPIPGPAAKMPDREGGLKIVPAGRKK